MSGNYLAVNQGDAIELRDGDNPDVVVKVLPLEGSSSRHVICFSATGTLLAVISGIFRQVLIYDVETGAMVAKIEEDEFVCFETICFHCSDNNLLLSREKYGRVSLWNIASQQRLWGVDVNIVYVSVYRICFSSDGLQVIANSDSGDEPSDSDLVVLDAANGSLLVTLRGHTNVIRCISVSPMGGLVASCSYDRLVILWDLSLGSQIRTLADLADLPQYLSFLPDGSKLIVAIKGSIMIYVTDTWEQLFCIPYAFRYEWESQIVFITVNSVCNRIAWTFWNTQQLVVYDLDLREEIFTVSTRNKSCACCFSPATSVILM
jgi:WD40 repeat protein